MLHQSSNFGIVSLKLAENPLKCSVYLSAEGSTKNSTNKYTTLKARELVELVGY